MFALIREKTKKLSFDRLVVCTPRGTPETCLVFCTPSGAPETCSIEISSTKYYQQILLYWSKIDFCYTRAEILFPPLLSAVVSIFFIVGFVCFNIIGKWSRGVSKYNFNIHLKMDINYLQKIKAKNLHTLNYGYLDEHQIQYHSLSIKKEKIQIIERKCILNLWTRK